MWKLSELWFAEIYVLYFCMILKVYPFAWRLLKVHGHILIKELVYQSSAPHGPWVADTKEVVITLVR